MNDQAVRSELESLRARIDRLEVRLAQLEGRDTGRAPEPASPRLEMTPSGAAVLPEQDTFAQTADAVPVLGRVLLILAGAYLLRALTDLGTLARPAGVFLGIIYAIFWQAIAARAGEDKKFEATLRSLVSALVLAPLLWEATVRYQVISNWTAAAVLGGFTYLGLALSWRRNLTHVAWIATLTGVLTSLALFLATRDVIPFTTVLLAVAAAVEASAGFEHWLGQRWMAAIAADLAVLIVTYLITGPHGLPEGYVPVWTLSVFAVQFALLLIYLAGAGFRTLWRGHSFTNFEIAQSAAAFLIGVGGALRMTERHPGALAGAAAVTVVCGAACYLISFAFLERKGRHDRNFYTYSVYGMLLVLAGSRILLAPTPLAAFWSALALICLAIGARWNRVTLGWHGALYLLLAGLASGFIGDARSLLVSTATGWGLLDPDAWITAAAALVAIVLARAYRGPDRASWPYQSVFVLLTAAGAVTAAALLAGGLTGLYHSLLPTTEIAYCATLRTIVLVGAAVLMAWFGTRWSQKELHWIAYAFMAAGAYKLLSQDLLESRTLVMFLSLLFYGGALILLPRLVRTAAKDQLRSSSPAGSS